MNAIDLFAGCGGLSKGFMDAGYHIIVGVDNDQAALNTFTLNHPGATAMNADLSKQETFDEIQRVAGDRSIDVIIGGPPCQGFSLTGPRNFDDKRNQLYVYLYFNGVQLYVANGNDFNGYYHFDHKPKKDLYEFKRLSSINH